MKIKRKQVQKILIWANLQANTHKKKTEVRIATTTDCYHSYDNSALYAPLSRPAPPKAELC